MRHLWDLKGHTVCRMLGTSLDKNDLEEIAKKLRIDGDPAYLHGYLVSACKTRNHISKMVERILLRKFYNISLTPQEAFEQIKSGNCKTPIGALIWIACQDRNLEPLTFQIVHMRELESLRNRSYDYSSIEMLRARVEELRGKIEKLKKKRDELISEKCRLRNKVFELTKELNRLKSEKVEMEVKFNRIGGDYAFERIKELEMEVKVLKGEVRRQLKREIRRQRAKMK